MTEKPSIRPVVLSGGAGKRLWPVSRALYPKQFQRLGGEQTLLQETVSRVPSPTFLPPIIVCNEEHRFIVGEQLSECDASAREIILEPESRGTAPAIALAALWMERHDPDSVMLILPSDHAIDRADDFADTVLKAVDAAQKGAIATFGVSATSIQPEFGYIQPAATGSSLLNDGAPVSEFVENPNVNKAEDMLARGALWNSGIFLLSPQTGLRQFHQFAATMLDQCRTSFDQAERDLDFLRVNEEAFTPIPFLSFGSLIFEHTKEAVVFLLDDGWQDLRTWASFHNRATNPDKDGNVNEGDVISVNCENTFVRSDGMLTATIGLRDVAVVATDDAILVSDITKTDAVETLVDMIAESGATHHLHHPTIYRPWGSFRTILEAPEFKVKELVVKPGARLSLQSHKHRAEHWVVVEGTADVHRDGDDMLLQENQSTYIPIGTRHRLANPGRIPLRVVEVQTGSYLGEDDIVRFEDTYGRQ